MVFQVKRALAIVFLIVLWNVHYVQSQSFISEYSHIQSLSLEDGLSQVNVNAVLKDAEGFIWVGTNDGLNRFDGYSFEVFNHQEFDSTSLGDNKIYSLFEDSNDNLWVGTNLAGLHLYNKKTKSFRRYIHRPGDANSLTSNSILKITEDKNGILWIATIDGLNAFDPRNNTVKRFKSNRDSLSIIDNYVYDVLVDSQNRIWLGTRGGVSVIDNNTGTIKNYYPNAADPSSISGNEVNCVFEDSQREIWLGTTTGLSRFNKRENNFTNFYEPLLSKNFVRTILEDHKGNLWFGTDGGGITIYNRQLKSFQHFSANTDVKFRKQAIYCLLQASDDAFWVGTYDDGIKILSRNRKKFNHIEYFNEYMQKNGKNTVRSLVQDPNGNIWIGTDGSGLFEYDPLLDKYTHYLHDPKNINSISNDVVKTIAVNKESIYVGHYNGGLSRINKSTKVVERYYRDLNATNSLKSNSVWSLFIDHNNRIWMGTLGGGLSEFLPDKKIFINYVNNADDKQSISSNNISKVFEDSQGNLWVGTINNGINRMLKDGTFKRYKQDISQSMGVNYIEVIDIFEDQKNRLYITTNGGGLYQYNADKDTFIAVGKGHGLKNVLVSIIDDNEGNLWMGTFHGICKYNPEEKRATYYNEYDGVLSDELKSGAKLRTSSGVLYFGGANGVTYFNPTDIVEDTVTSEVIFTDLLLFHEKVLIDDPANNILTSSIQYQNLVELEYNQNTITINYTSLNYDLPQSSQYAYLLDGFDMRWNEVGSQRSATYTNLPPGEYTFKVKATGIDGTWNGEVSSIKIIVKPPFWNTWWFIMITIGIVVSLVYFIVTFRIKQLNRAKRILGEMVDVRTVQLKKLVKELQEKQTEIESTNLELTATLKDLYHEKSKVECMNGELKRSDEELRAINEHLDKIVQERTAELVKANEELDRFVYSASHDLSAPLKSILGLIQLTKLETKNTSLINNISYMETSVYKLDNVIQSLTQFSRNMGLGITKNKFPFEEVVNEVLVDLGYLFESNHVKLRKNYTTIDILESDFLRVKILLTNLVSNAIKYRDPEKKETVIDIDFSAKNGSYVIKITDNGIGIAQEYHSKIFNMFYRATYSGDGSGLGLYIVKETINKLKGKISIQSSPLQFTSFIIQLPK